MSRPLYSLLLYLLLPWALFHLIWRAFRQPAYLSHIGERFGIFPNNLPSGVIWIHAVSVGETRAAQPLIEALQQRYPDHGILLSHGTPTGRQTGVELYGERVARCYLPYDFNWAAKRFLRRFRPVVGIVMETEIWPNLIRASANSAVPVFLVNARMSEKSARGYRRIRGLTSHALATLSGIGAQTGADAQRLSELGAKSVKITGNIKFDRLVPAEMLTRGTHLRGLFGAQRPILLAASTRDGEEAMILDAFAGSTIPGLLIVIVPRHPQRFGAVAALARQRSYAVSMRSENRPVPADVRVVIGDSMGEMFAYYVACDIAFIGGSLLPLGGQNLLEACAVGRPVLIGPHTFNFHDATLGAIGAGAAVRVANADDLATAIDRLFADADLRRTMSEAGKRFTEAHRGATQKTLEILRW